MHATAILPKSFQNALSFVHKKRLEALFFGVDALIAGGRLSLTALGRSARGPVAPKHYIKRIDRLLGNPYLYNELPEVFGAISQLLLEKSERPLILIDWTRLDDNYYSLSAAVPLDGRALPVYWEVHSSRKVKNREVQTQFLKNLHALMPRNVRPIIVTDAGFQNSWFKVVAELGWDYVGRLSGWVSLRQPMCDQWRLAPSYYPDALATQPRDLGVCMVGKALREDFHRVILAQEFVRNPRRSKARRRRCDRGRGHTQAVKRNKEPWLIATSLLEPMPREIIRIYAQRMQIEENYRDVKNSRFGWNFSHAKTKNPKRYAVMLLVASIGMLVMTLVGQAAENENHHRPYQANTLKNRRVLSLFFLAKSMLLRDDLKWCKLRHMKEAFWTIQRKIGALTLDCKGELVGIR